MPRSTKVSKTLARQATRAPRIPISFVLANKPPKIDYPQGTWAILKPVNNANSFFLPEIFLTEPFNCLGKFPESNPSHHQLPMDSRISDRHCQIRIENVTDANGASSPKIIFEDISKIGTMVDSVLIRRDNKKAVEIKHGSRITFPASRVPSGFYEYVLDVIDLQSNGSFDKVYRLCRLLGNGHFSEVHKAKRLCDGKVFAVKVLKKPTVTSEIQKQDKMIKNEIQVLNSLGHENLIKIFDYYEEPDSIKLVIEYVEDGELHEYFKERRLTEQEVRVIFTQLFSAIKYLHDRQIVHRDLKPENILMPSKEGLRIKVTDFGLSKLLNIDYSTMQTKCGTVSYVAPEVLESSKERSYNKAVDMWSAGVILYVCLSGELPFSGDKPNEVIHKIRRGAYSMNSSKWDPVSYAAKSLVRSLLTVNPQERLTVEGALNHPFIKHEQSIPKPFFCNGIREYKKSDKASTDDLFYSCVSQFSELSTSGEQSYITASETIRSYSVDCEVSTPSASASF